MIATEAIEYVATALKKMHEVAGNSSSIKIVECLSHIHGSGTCQGLRFIGDIVKASHSCEEGGGDFLPWCFPLGPSHETDRRVEQDRACPFHATCNLYHCQFTHLIHSAWACMHLESAAWFFLPSFAGMKDLHPKLNFILHIMITFYRAAAFC